VSNKKNILIFTLVLLLFSCTEKITYESKYLVATPIINVPAGMYSSPQSVSISCTTSNATIRYSTNGTEPTSSSPVYSSPINISTSTTLKARAFKTDWLDSPVATAEYIFAVATPTFDLPQGTYFSTQAVSTNCATIDVMIRYTTNGIEPTSSSPIYFSPINLNTTTTLQARAFKTDWLDSQIAMAEYVITGTVANLTFAPPPGTYTSPQNVEINCLTEDAIIHYTTNGTEPTESSPLYSEPIEVATTTTLKARAFKSEWLNSQITIGLYTIRDVEGTVTDIDGNVYQTLVIGNQEWMVENLKVTHYRNNNSIPHLIANSDWTNTASGAYCVIDNNPSNADTYGNLYNWHAVDDSRGLAPEGWRVPSDEDFIELEIYLGMTESEAHSTGNRGTNEGSKLAGEYDLWTSGALRNDPEFDTSGFSLLPGGSRNVAGTFSSVDTRSYIWTSTEDSSSYAWYRLLQYIYSAVYRTYTGGHKRIGYSVRCVRDLK
jgi:uncharacterized protein (TIGR02145 family)